MLSIKLEKLETFVKNAFVSKNYFMELLEPVILYLCLSL